MGQPAVATGVRGRRQGRDAPAPDGRYAIDPGGLPIHGALPGLLRWELIETGAPDRISARLDWGGPALLELFPFEHELRFDAIVGDGGL